MADDNSTKCNKWKATIVFYSMDPIGHINPILSIVRELRDRNYRAIILTTRPLNCAARLKSQGFELDYCEKAPSSADQPDASQQITRINSNQMIESVMESVKDMFSQAPKDLFMATYGINGVVGRYARDMIARHDIVEAKLRSLAPDIIVVDHVIGAPCVTKVARKWVRTYSPYPSILYSAQNENFVAGLGLKLEEMTPELKEFERQIRGELRDFIVKFWHEKGEPGWPNPIDYSPTSAHLNFCFGPEELSLTKVPTIKPLAGTWLQLEHTIDKNYSGQGERFQVPDCLAKMPGKLIYFSLGTVVNSDAGLINRLLEILSKSPNRFIISKGTKHELIKLYPNMWGQKYVDQKAVLPEIDLFITHSGHNSIMEAFYYGCPGLITLPVFGDQLDLSQRLEDCGFAKRLNPFKCSPDELLQAVNSALANEELKKRMKSIGERLRSIKYHEIAADRLIELL